MNPPGPQAVRPLTVLSEEETLFRTAVRDYAQTVIAPLVARMDEEARYDPILLPGLFDLGVMGIEIPEQYGGPGSSFFMACLAVEEISRVDPAVGVLVDVHNTLVTNALLRWGTPAQHATFFPRLTQHTIGAYALSEAGSGSDAFALQTRATRDGDAYVLNGRKLWISNGREAGLYIIFATVDPGLGYRGITAFLVERDTPGFAVGRSENKLGIRASSTCELLLENCLVPQHHVLGAVGQGYMRDALALVPKWWGWRRVPCRPRLPMPSSGGSLAEPLPSFRACSFSSQRWRRNSKPHVCWCITRRA